MDRTKHVRGLGRHDQTCERTRQDQVDRTKHVGRLGRQDQQKLWLGSGNHITNKTLFLFFCSRRMFLLAQGEP